MLILQQFSPAKLTEGKEWFVSFYAFCPASNCMKRKKIKVNRIHPLSERRRFAKMLINNINQKLYHGWNPFIDPDAKKSYLKFSDAINHFWKIAEKRLAEDTIREDTYRDYLSYPKNLQRWLNDTGRGDVFVYELDRKLMVQFLDYIYVDRNNSATTRNNYLSFLRTFAGFLVENEYIKTRFTDGISNLKRSKKKRTRLEKEDMERLRNYLHINNPYFLLACEIQYYAFIRPKELSMLRIIDIDFVNATINIPGAVSKNRQSATVTLPTRLIDFMVHLKINLQENDMYLFSDKFMPGKKFRMDKHFRDYWLKLRKELQFPDRYQFYSLKDTGITDMLHHVGDTVMVRDQARHSSISITNIYTQGGLTRANETIKKLDY
jgi:integrase